MYKFNTLYLYIEKTRLIIKLSTTSTGCGKLYPQEHFLRMGDDLMAKFRKKPVEIEAIQFNGENYNEIINFVGIALHFDCRESRDNYITIPTLEGDMKASVSDWIIKGVNGEFYPCKPDIFAKTYEQVQ
jgi:hypothetical protein